MGCGKSAIGKRLSRKLDLPFIDLDTKIETIAKMPVKDIFARHGEPYFRKLELETMKQALNEGQAVIATGGGAFVNDEIRALVKQSCISVWIKADLHILLERVSHRNTRPLLEHGNKEDILKDLMDKRYPIYAEADIIVSTSHGTYEIVLRKIIEAIARV